jgi:peptide/nickel transport system substrate-binding protein
VIKSVFSKACLVGLTAVLTAAVPSAAAWAQKQGGILRITHRDSPSSMSIHEEGTISVVLPMMGVFNNLVMFDPHQRQNSLDGIVPEVPPKGAEGEGHTGDLRKFQI